MRLYVNSCEVETLKKALSVFEADTEAEDFKRDCLLMRVLECEKLQGVKQTYKESKRG